MANETTVQLSYRPMLIALGLIVVLGAIVYTAFRNWRHVVDSDMRLCAGCATPNPKHAAFCRKCGRKIG